MAGKSLLLDIDGVIVRDKLLMAHVSDNCVKYVQSKLPECRDPRKLNQVLYLTHGHTARGLTHSFGIKTSDFNDFVYDKSLMEHLGSVLSTHEFQDDAKEIRDFSKKGWKVTLFTNAPAQWGTSVARAIGDDVFLKCPGNDVNKSSLKPDASAFTDFPKTQTHIYVDDSLKNLGTARWLPNWHPIHFDHGVTVDVLATGHKPWCPTIGSIWELGLFLGTADHHMDRHEPRE